MTSHKLRIDSRPDLEGGRLVLAFSGWMDGGEVSTGTVKGLIDELGARPFAEIDPEGFYVCSFPGDQETTALVRPHIRVRDGLVESVELRTLRLSRVQKLGIRVIDGGGQPVPIVARSRQWCPGSR